MLSLSCSDIQVPQPDVPRLFEIQRTAVHRVPVASAFQGGDLCLRRAIVIFDAMLCLGSEARVVKRYKGGDGG